MSIAVKRIYEIEGGATIREALECLPNPATGDTVRWWAPNGELRELALQVDAPTGDVYWSDPQRAEGGWLRHV